MNLEVHAQGQGFKLPGLGTPLRLLSRGNWAGSTGSLSFSTFHSFVVVTHSAQPRTDLIVRSSDYWKTRDSSVRPATVMLWSLVAPLITDSRRRTCLILN